MGAAAITRQLRLLREAIAASGGGGGGSDSSLWKAPYGSLAAAVQDPALAQARGSLNSNQVYVSRVYVPDPITLSKAHFIVSTVAVGVTAAEVCVWSPIKTGVGAAAGHALLGKSGDIASLMNSTAGSVAGPREAALTAQPGKSLAMPGGDGSWVLVGIRQTGGTARAALAGYPLVGSVANLDGSPPRAASLGSQVATPDPLLSDDIAVASTQMIWFGLS